MSFNSRGKARLTQADYTKTYAGALHDYILVEDLFIHATLHFGIGEKC
jgi:hypothetical protein